MSPLSLEPLSAISASSPVLPPPPAALTEPLALPLSKEMSLYEFFHRRFTGAYTYPDALARCSRHTNSSQSLFWIQLELTSGVGLYIILIRHYVMRVSWLFNFRTRLLILLLQGNYSMEQEAGEPDPHVIDLNNELGECDEFLSTSLPETARRQDTFFRAYAFFSSILLDLYSLGWDTLWNTF